MLLLSGCVTGPLSTAPDSCDPDPPAVGEVRARQITCTAEIPASGEAYVGDWLLENSLLRLTIRNIPNRMTQLNGAGGTVIDAALHGTDDAIVELIPVVNEGWPTALNITADGDTLLLTAEDGSERVWRYRLTPDSGLLTLEGAEGFTLVPAINSVVNGIAIQAGAGLSIAAPSPLEDHGGWVDWRDTETLALGSPSMLTKALYSEHTTATGQSTGDVIEVAVNGSSVFEIPVVDGSFEIDVPVGAQLRTTMAGHIPSGWASASSDMDLNIGDGGFLLISVFDETGKPIPATLDWNGATFSVLDTPKLASVGPGDGSGFVDAGPEFIVHELDTVSITGEVELEVIMERTAPDAALAAFGVPGFPDKTERRSAGRVLKQLASTGVDYAVLTAVDEVSQTSSSTTPDHLISVSSSSQSGGPLGAIFTWPWSANDKRAAHGAVNWEGMSALDLLAIMSKSGRRTAAVDATWVEAAGPVSGWAPSPQTIYIDGPSDLAHVAAVFDQWLPIALVGERTWVHVDGRTSTEIQRGIFEGRTAPTTGPQIGLLVDGAAPGDAFVEAQTRAVSIAISNPGDVSTVYLLGPLAEIIQAWDIDDLPAETEIDHAGWVIAVAEGDTSWSVTSPVWLSRP